MLNDFKEADSTTYCFKLQHQRLSCFDYRILETKRTYEK